MYDSEFRSWLSSAQERYEAAKKHLDDSKNDPPNEPYRSKYKAKEILLTLLNEIETKWKSIENLRMTVLHAGFSYELGVIALDTEEISDGCNFLTSCWEKIKDCSSKPESCALALKILNQLGILWSGRGESLKALSFLDEAVKVYNHYKENNEISPYSFEDIFEASDNEKSDWSSFEKTFTHTLYYLAQVYEHLNYSDNTAKYCHQTLKRQIDSDDFDSNDWAINCATLSQYYVQNKLFCVARHLLACSSYVLKQHESKIKIQNADKDVLDELSRCKAEVSWCWLKYCINLLSESQNSSADNENKNSEIITGRFSDEKDVLLIEEQVPSEVSSFEEARAVFLFGQNKVDEAKLFYALDSHANNNVQIVQDYSKLYKNLAYYENDLSRLCKMHKRRIDMLEDVLAKLNPQYYLAVCRQLQFELGETYYEMVDLKYKIGNSNTQNLSVHNVKKINSLIMCGIGHFNGFINSLKGQDENLPAVFTDDLVRPALIAHFYLGSMYSKFVESETSKKLSNLAKSEAHYKFVLDYVERNAHHVKYIEKELQVIKEMVQLMPERKIQVTGTTLF